MDKLELKHLTLYLPYKLKVLDTISNKQKVMNLGQGSSVNWVGIKTVLNYNDGHNCVYKPILKPFENLHSDDIFLNFLGERKIEYKNHPVFYKDMMGFWHHKLESESLTKNPMELYMFFEKLFEHHYDVFGLISKGLAMNINEHTCATLKYMISSRK